MAHWIFGFSALIFVTLGCFARTLRIPFVLQWHPFGLFQKSSFQIVEVSDPPSASRWASPYLERFVSFLPLNTLDWVILCFLTYDWEGWLFLFLKVSCGCLPGSLVNETHPQLGFLISSIHTPVIFLEHRFAHVNPGSKLHSDYLLPSPCWIREPRVGTCLNVISLSLSTFFFSTWSCTVQFYKPRCTSLFHTFDLITLFLLFSFTIVLMS